MTHLIVIFLSVFGFHVRYRNLNDQRFQMQFSKHRRPIRVVLIMVSHLKRNISRLYEILYKMEGSLLFNMTACALIIEVKPFNIITLARLKVITLTK
jgi:hypothetical protein